MAIFAIEYIGIGNYIPGAQKITLFLSLSIFFSVFFRYDSIEIFKHRQTKVFIIFLLHTAFSMGYAFIGSYALHMFKVQIGYFILFIITYIVLKKAKQIRFLMASFVIFHCFVIVANLNKFGSSIRLGGFTAGYFLGDGNDLAWSLSIFIPFAIYLLTINRNKIKKGLLVAAIGLFVTALIGTGSRGGFLSINAALCYLIVNSKNRVRNIIVYLIVVVISFALAPPSYIDRMWSIKDYQEDSSALGRITAWKAAVRMAIDHPLGVGAGNFNSAYGRFYRPSEIDPRIWSGERWISPHSIYFLVLGEYGVVGLVTIITLMALNFHDNQKQVSTLRGTSSLLSKKRSELVTLPKYLNMSLVSLCTGGIFLGGLSYPHIFVLTALILRTRQINAIKVQR